MAHDPYHAKHWWYCSTGNGRRETEYHAGFPRGKCARVMHMELGHRKRKILYICETSKVFLPTFTNGQVEYWEQVIYFLRGMLFDRRWKNWMAPIKEYGINPKALADITCGIVIMTRLTRYLICESGVWHTCLYSISWCARCWQANCCWSMFEETVGIKNRNKNFKGNFAWMWKR